MKEEQNKNQEPDLEPEQDARGGGLLTDPLGAGGSTPDGLQQGEATGFHQKPASGLIDDEIGDW